MKQVKLVWLIVLLAWVTAAGIAAAVTIHRLRVVGDWLAAHVITLEAEIEDQMRQIEEMGKALALADVYLDGYRISLDKKLIGK